MQLQHLYDQAPVCLQQLMCSLKGWLIRRRRYGRGFYEALHRYEHHDIQPDRRLLRFLGSLRFVPAYKQTVESPKFRELYNTLTQSGVADLHGGVEELLGLFPVIGKNEVKQHLTDYINTAYAGPVIRMHTSGTTGGGLSFPYSVEMENEQWAVWWRFRRSLGLDLTTWCGWLGGRVIISPQDRRRPWWRTNRPGRQVMFSLYHLTPATVADYHGEIRRRSLTWLHGYPSSVTRLASLITEAKLPPLECVSIITTGAENLDEHQLAQIRRAFPQAIVRTHYGLAEGVANISQDIHGQWHIDSDFAHVEFLPVDPADPSLCRIVGTGMANSAFPLVRYDTGDVARVRWHDGQPEVLSIDGRSDDYITLPNGARLNSGLDYILKDSIHVHEAQLCQKSLYAFELRIVRRNGYSETDEQHIRQAFQQRLGEQVSLTFSYVSDIQKTKAGKFKMFVSEL